MAALRDAADAHTHTSVPLLREVEHDHEHGHDHDHGINHGLDKETKPLLQARLRLYWLATVLCCGALLFGYDSGLMGQLLLKK